MEIVSQSLLSVGIAALLLPVRQKGTHFQKLQGDDKGHNRAMAVASPVRVAAADFAGEAVLWLTRVGPQPCTFTPTASCCRHNAVGAVPHRPVAESENNSPYVTVGRARQSRDPNNLGLDNSSDLPPNVVGDGLYMHQRGKHVEGWLL